MERQEEEKNSHDDHAHHHHQEHVHNHDSHKVHNHKPGGHDGHEHHGHHDHGDMVWDFKKRFFISLIVTIPILALSPMIQDFIGVDWRFATDEYILFILSTFVFFYGGWPFITGGVD